MLEGTLFRLGNHPKMVGHDFETVGLVPVGFLLKHPFWIELDLIM